MPLYEYQCSKCGRKFEKIETVDAPETRKCPHCGAKAPRMFSAPAIQFKGTGWYVTDYGGKNNSAAAAAERGEGKSEGKSDGKSEGKPEGKSERKSEGKSSEGPSGSSSEKSSKKSSESKSSTKKKDS